MSAEQLAVLLPTPAGLGDDQVGGVATFCDALLDALRSRDDVVARVIRPASAGAATRSIDAAGIDTVEIDVGPGPWHRRLRELSRVASRHIDETTRCVLCTDYWVVPQHIPASANVTTFVHLLPSQLARRLAAERLPASLGRQLPRVLDGPLALASRWPLDAVRPAVSLATEREALRRSDRILVNHESLRTAIALHTSAPVHTVDLGYPSPTGRSRPRGETRHTLGLTREDLVLVTCGRLHPQKGLHTLIDASARVHTDRHRPVLVLLGPTCIPSYTRSLHRRASRHPQLEVRMPGTVSAAERDVWFAAADCYLTGAIYEPHGLAVREAITAGLPVAGIAVDGLVEPLSAPGNVGIPLHPKRTRSARLVAAIETVLTIPRAAARPPVRTLREAANECLDLAMERGR